VETWSCGVAESFSHPRCRPCPLCGAGHVAWLVWTGTARGGLSPWSSNLAPVREGTTFPGTGGEPQAGRSGVEPWCEGTRAHSLLGPEPSWWPVTVLAVPLSDEASFFPLCLVLWCKKGNWRCLDPSAGVLGLQWAQLPAHGCLLMPRCRPGFIPPGQTGLLGSAERVARGLCGLRQR